MQDPRTFLTTLKVDLYPDEVYAFTPKGEVFSFPRGATPLDFAYRVHTDLGHHCAGARVNGKLVPLRTPLANGDMVEVLTNPTRNPSRDWLNLVTTSRAKSKIRQWLNTQQKQRAMEIGRRMFDKEIRKYGLSLRKVTEGPELKTYLHARGARQARRPLQPDRLRQDRAAHRARAGGGAGEARRAPAEKPGRLRQAVSKILPFGATASPLTVKGHGDLLAYLAKCCNPLPGEDIVGYITRGRGVSVHRVDCPNVQNLLYNPEREIEVQWEQGKNEVYQVSLLIEVEDQQGMLARLTEAITRAGSNITSIEADTHSETGRGTISVVCQLRDRKHLDKLLREVRGISGVLRVDRRTTTGSRRQLDALS